MIKKCYGGFNNMKEILLKKRIHHENGYSLNLITSGDPKMIITTHIFRDEDELLLTSIHGLNNVIEDQPLPYYIMLYKLSNYVSSGSFFIYKNIIIEIIKFIIETSDKDIRNYFEEKKRSQISTMVKNKKYMFTGKRMFAGTGVTLFQIKAVKDFDNIKAGDIGGWIESDKNLSHTGNCWIDKNSLVYGDVTVSGDIQIENSTVNGSQVNLNTVESIHPTKFHRIVHSTISGNDITISNSDIFASQIIANHIDIENCCIAEQLIKRHPMEPPAKMKLAYINITADNGHVRNLPENIR